MAALVGLGLTIVPAHAADDPYVASVATHCDLDGVKVIKRGADLSTQVEIRANGNTRPKGTVTLDYSRDGGGFHATRSAHYAGKPINVKGPTLTRIGHYTIKAKFAPADGSRFRACSGSIGVQVKNGVGPNNDHNGNGGDNPGVGPDNNGILPGTGGPDLLWLLLALGLVAGGTGLVYYDRRRRHAHA
jgi:hypothetical protein